MNCYAALTVHKDGKPAHLYIENGDRKISYDIYRPGSGRKIGSIIKRIEASSNILNSMLWCNLKTPNLGVLFRSFGLNELARDNQVRDYGIAPLSTTGSESGDSELCGRVISIIKNAPELPYQTILSRAQSVYYGLEKSGLNLNYTHVSPKWTWDTFSGRSKSTEFNIQGWHEPDVIYQPTIPYDNVQIHFDWICADLRVAAILSGDRALNESFQDSDPYSYLSKRLSGSDAELRDEVKILLLKTINSLDYNNDIISNVFPTMCSWIKSTLESIRATRRSTNIVGRPFVISKDRTERSLFNAVLQGSVASAIQNVAWVIRNTFPDYYVCDIHDGIVLSVPNDNNTISRVIKTVGPVFIKPFSGILDDNHNFPYRLSIGKRWKQWKPMRTVRSDQT